MKSPVQLRRVGSLLIPAGTEKRVARGTRKPFGPDKKPSSRKRTSYSQHYVLSPTADQVCLSSRGLANLLAWADTEPGVADVALVNSAVLYQDAGRTKTTRVPLRLTWRTGAVEYWDFAFVDPAESEWSGAIAAKRAFAKAEGAGYWLASGRFFSDRPWELNGRLALQNVLFSGRGLDSSEAEASILLQVSKVPRTVAELAATLQYADSLAMLAVARLWRSGKVSLPLATAGLNMRCLVKRSTQDGR
jgi:hypothetical protein